MRRGFGLPVLVALVMAAGMVPVHAFTSGSAPSSGTASAVACDEAGAGGLRVPGTATCLRLTPGGAQGPAPDPFSDAFALTAPPSGTPATTGLGVSLQIMPSVSAEAFARQSAPLDLGLTPPDRAQRTELGFGLTVQPERSLDLGLEMVYRDDQASAPGSAGGEAWGGRVLVRRRF